ncbi:pirin family protein [Oceanisphaera pacifica]|uniref:Pirin family protein n=1 Tax=Oceanisphaera pacifica TaxID=2818389 RepID=A0ABS3NEQ9_9GAMM|nr:pirin family protein [Oceanisphaera pacifica]MBO1519069.1 pirin family protein [Oceanisphaera pacifica]
MMSIQTLEPRLADVGGIPIARLLPNRGKQPIGAWCFLDHAGPADFDEDDLGMQVGRHPHTNLQTFSWMLNGEVLHKDSLGNELSLLRIKSMS